MNLDSIRRAVRAKGLTPATLVPEASGGRVEEACIRPARVVEGDSLRMIPIGLAEAWPGSLAYLDGIQRSEIIAYDGSAPIVVAEIAAAVRVREDRRLHTSVQERRRVALGRPSALAAAGDALAELQAIPLPEDEPPHPLRDLVNAGHALDQARGALEVVVGDRYRSRLRWMARAGRLAGGESPLGSGPSDGGHLEESLGPAVRRQRPGAVPAAALRPSLLGLRTGHPEPGAGAGLGSSAVALGRQGSAPRPGPG